jgi:hypothetical protein
MTKMMMTCFQFNLEHSIAMKLIRTWLAALNQPNQYGMTPFHCVCDHGNTAMIAILKQYCKKWLTHTRDATTTNYTVASLPYTINKKGN